MEVNIHLKTDEAEEELRGDTEDEGIEHDADEEELEVEELEVDDNEGRRKLPSSTGSSLWKSGVARELVTHCRFYFFHLTCSNNFIIFISSYNYSIIPNNDTIIANNHSGTTLLYPPRLRPTTERCAELW